MGMQVLKMLAYPLAYYIVCCSAERQASYFVHLFVCFYFLSVFFFSRWKKTWGQQDWRDDDNWRADKERGNNTGLNTI